MPSTTSMLCDLINSADKVYDQVVNEFPGTQEIFDKMMEAKAAGGFKTVDEWEMKYSAIVTQMGLINLGIVLEEDKLSPKTAAQAWFEALGTFYQGTGILDFGKEGLEAFVHSMIPAEVMWLAVLDANHGKDFTQKCMKARDDHANKFNDDKKGFQ